MVELYRLVKLLLLQSQMTKKTVYITDYVLVAFGIGYLQRSLQQSLGLRKVSNSSCDVSQEAERQAGSFKITSSLK